MPPPPAYTCTQIIEWFEQYTDVHSELGESQQVAERLAKEVTDFETFTQVYIYMYVVFCVASVLQISEVL